jgi:chemotaxis protein CheD
VGAVLCDPEARVAALLHFMLPNSEIDPIRARTRPMMFADLGLPAAAQACVRLGAKPTRWVARLAGGAAVQGGPSGFDIGARNIEAAMYHLHLLAIPVVAQELGGTISRTLHVDVPTGRARVLTPGLPDRLL